MSANWSEPEDRRIVLVGGGLAAARTSEQLRRNGFRGQITLVSDEPHLPYDRPPLSKGVLWRERDGTTLKPREFFDQNAIDLRLGCAAQAVDTEARTVQMDDGNHVPYDDLVICTGLIPRRIPGWADSSRIRVIRTLDDALSLRAALPEAHHVVVIGAGFIGCEVASSVRRMGIPVTLIEPQQQPLASVLGEPIGALIARLHRSEGVDLRTGTGLAAAAESGENLSVTLTDGGQLTADLAVMGIGSRPATDWLIDSGITLNDGIECDDVGRTSVPNVWALGDVASWADAAGSRRRIEHWSNVGEQVRALVPALLGGDEPTATVSVPYFWSDQYDLKIQCVGHPSPGDTVHIVEDDGRGFLAYYERGGLLVAAVGGGRTGQVMKARTSIEMGMRIADLTR